MPYQKPTIERFGTFRDLTQWQLCGGCTVPTTVNPNPSTPSGRS